jgi:hypothetical protein
MIHDDFDDLDRALAALPLEEPPAALHARILATTVYRAAPTIHAWEVWLIGTLVACGAWLVCAVASAPHASERLVDAVTRAMASGLPTPDYTVLWLAVGVSTAWWISLLTFPSRPRKRIEAR